MPQNNEIVVPDEKFFDKLTSQYDLSIANLRLLAGLKGSIDQLNKALPLILASSISDKAALINGSVLPYQVFSIPLDAVLSDESHDTLGLMTVFAIGTDGLIAPVSVRFNTPQANLIPLGRINPIPINFYRFFITNSVAQPGKTLTVYCSNGNQNVGTGIMNKASVSGAVQTIYSAALLAAGTYYSTMMDCRSIKRIAFRLINGLDVDCTAQVIANFTDSSADADLLASPVLVGTGDHDSIVPAWDDWQPYMGVVLEVTNIPTSGTLAVEAVVQE